MHTQTVDALIAAAELSAARGNVAQAEQLLEKALATAQSLYGRLSPVTGLILLKLIDIYDPLGRIDKAELARRSIAEIMTENWSSIRAAHNGLDEPMQSCCTAGTGSIDRPC